MDVATLKAKIKSKQLPSSQPERLTDDDFETIRIHINAYKEKLCNQQRWEEADEYQRIIDRFMAFASAQPEIIVDGYAGYADGFADGYKQGQKDAQPERKTGKWNFIGDNMFECTSCGVVYTTNQLNNLRNCDTDPYAPKFCPNCGAEQI